MKISDLLKGGYLYYHDTSSFQKYGASYLGSYQRSFSDDLGTRYFITVDHGFIPANNGFARREFFAMFHQFNGNGITFNVELLYNDETLEEMERFFENLWNKMRLDYFEGRVQPEVIPRMIKGC